MGQSQSKDVPSWKSAAAAKVAHTLEKIPPEWRLDDKDLERASKQKNLSGPFIHGFLTLSEREIVKTPADKIVEQIVAEKLTAVKVVQAFCRTAAVAHQINNCLHEIFFIQAMERAEFLDNYMHEHKRPLGPLHGLPVSLKDQFHVKGNDTTMGYVGWIGTYEGSKNPDLVHKVDSQVVKELLSLGAVLYCKTSLPQTLLFGETVNNIIGRTLNPVNQALSCGGSSGGEGALQALTGSPVGLGTDIGGSVRIPAAFCGIFSVKPTHNRLSYRDAANTNPGQDTYASSVGILGATIEAVGLVLESIISTKPWLRDPNVVPIPWSHKTVGEILKRANPSKSSAAKPLKLGVYWTDGVVTPHPPVTRGLKLVADAVQKAGHTVVDWNPPTQTTAKRVHLSFLKADGGYDIHKQLDLSGEPLIPALRKSFQLREPDSLIKYQDSTIEGKAYCEAYSDYWNSTSDGDGQLVDAVIMPVAPHAAVIPGKYYHTAYTEAINLMDYSAVVIPVTHADKTKDQAEPGYIPLNELDKLNWEAYDADVYDTAPVGIQLIGRKYEEEKIWAIGKVVHSLLLEHGYGRSESI